MANVQYKNNKIQINLTGFIALFVNQITINDSQLILALDDIINQIQKKYIDDLTYVTKKFYDTIKSLSGTELYKPKTAEEKTLYDLTVLILLNYCKGAKEAPIWINDAINRLEQQDVIENLFNFIVEQVLSIFINISENVYIDLKVTFDSRILRVTLNRKTKHGQIAKLLKLFKIDINSIVKDFVEEYMSPSFIKGIGEFASQIVSSVLFRLPDSDNKLFSEQAFLDPPYKKGIIDLTLTLGRFPNTQRALRWYCEGTTEQMVVEYSEDKDFKKPQVCTACYKNILKPKTVFGLGLLSVYKTENAVKYSAVLKGLKQGKTYWYCIKNINGDLICDIKSFKMPNKKEEFTFLVLADSQGMVKSDYNVFLKAFAHAVKKINDSEFCTHLGDFVDDGNNENYWSWLLNNNIWSLKAVVPVAGNHEAIINHKALKSGMENSLIRHFFVEDMPAQNTSTGMYYSFNYKNALFIVLNTNDLDENNQLSKTQYDWAIKTAKNSKAHWKIVFSHKTPYSNGPHHEDDNVKKMSKQLNRLCLEAEIDLFIAGHDHVYLRTPILCGGLKVDHKTKFVMKDNIKYETAINPNGTLFIVPGTTGVKNYKQDLSLIMPSEFMSQPNCPVYSSVKVAKDRLYFLAYRYNIVDDTSSLLDCYAIEKNKSAIHKNISSFSGDFSLKQKFLKKQKKESLLEVTVSNKAQFLSAINDKKIGTIFTNGNDIKFETLFGKCKNIVINRDLYIKGNSRLLNVCFCVKDKATLLIGDLVFVDNSRNKNSIYKAMNVIEIYDAATLILDGNCALRTEYGIGKNGYCICLIGDNTSAYLNTASENFGAKGSVFLKSRSSKAIINNGTYTSNKKRYAIKTNGCVQINGGTVKSIEAFCNANIEITGGIIGEQKHDNYVVPIKSQANVYITGAQIFEKQGIAIVLNGKNSNLYLCPNHKGAISIAGQTPYLGPVKSITDEDVFIGIDESNVPNVGNKNSKVYTSSKIFKSFVQLVNSKSNILHTQVDGYIRAKIPVGKQYVFAKILYANKRKKNRAIFCNDTSNAYLYSNIKFVENNFKTEIQEKI